MLTRRLLNLQPTVRQRGNWWDAYYCSRIAYEFLTTVGEHPTGKKLGKLALPEPAHKSKSLLCGFICGLFTVEGSLKLGKYPRITIEMLEPTLIREVSAVLSENSLRPHTYSYAKGRKTMYGAYAYGRDALQSFSSAFGLVGEKGDRLTSFLS